MGDLYEAEQRKQARKVLRALALGLHPSTHDALVNSEVLHEPSVIRALILAIEAIKDVDRSSSEEEEHRPLRAGQAWTEIEDEELRSGFVRRLPLDELCEVHKRSSGSITSRLVRLKLVNERDDARKLLGQAPKHSRIIS